MAYTCHSTTTWRCPVCGLGRWMMEERATEPSNMADDYCEDMTEKVEIEPIDTTDTDKAAESFERLALAIEHATEAFKGLSHVEHGGVEVLMNGPNVVCKVRPAPPRPEPVAQSTPRHEYSTLV